MKILLSAGFLLASLASGETSGTTVTWQQAGGSFQSSPTLKGIVAQGYETPVASTATGEIRSGFLTHPLFLNQGPFVSSPLADQTLRQGSDATVLDLSSVFTSWEGNELIYSVSGGAGIAAARITGSKLALTGQSSGSATLVVTASDGALSAQDTFEVEVERATSIAPRPANAPKSGLLAASIAHPMASVAQGAGRAFLDIDGNCPADGCLSLEFSLPGPASVQVSIFDNLGTPVIAWTREFGAWDLNRMGRSPEGRSSVTLNWNLRASDGTAVAPGVYLWKVKALTQDGQKLETIKRMGVK